MDYDEILSWLLSGDVSIQYQVHRDLLGIEKPELRKRIESEGWGKQFLSARGKDRHWGKGFYQPKWISSHYTLLDLKNLGISRENVLAKETISMILEKEKGDDGGVNPSGTIKQSDVCINGMMLNYACYFNAAEDLLKTVVDFLLREKMRDGGFNCHSNRKGAVHSSLHTTLSVLEGIDEYLKNKYLYRVSELKEAKRTSEEFILAHRLFRSDRTGEIINPKFLRLCYPGRWNYDILRAMDYFRAAKTKYDERMDDALGFIIDKRTPEGLWKIPAHHKGVVHFDMEKPGTASRWNTLRALRVIRQYDKVYFKEIKNNISVTY